MQKMAWPGSYDMNDVVDKVMVLKMEKIDSLRQLGLGACCFVTRRLIIAIPILLGDFVNVAETMLSPDEPRPIDAAILRLDRNDYQARTWATRAHLWVDRVASAWLILCFIDRDASFLWFDSPADCPPDALDFDFDGATFIHVGDRVTFEVSVTSFGLEPDCGLQRLGALVHRLDVGGGVVPEASGFEAMLAGARQRASKDDQLLAEIGVVLDFLYAHFSINTQK